MDTKTVATKVVRKLTAEGFTSYFAGGWVRDFVMGIPSSDIDIATEAAPDVVMNLFEKTIPVGVAFASVIVVEEGIPFEVSSFREDEGYTDGRRPDSIRYSTPEADAHRRDFTINGMFYDPLKDEVIDYVGAREDLQAGIVRTIGDPNVRFKEDRLRMIRAVRFAARFGFPIEEATEIAIKELAPTLFPSVAIERVWQEFEKMRPFPRFDRALVGLARYGLLGEVFPQLKQVSSHGIEKRVRGFADMPGDCPTILFLLQLFPGASREEVEQVCRYLKCSNRDLALALQYEALLSLLDRGEGVEAVEWGRFYALPKAWLCLEVVAAALGPTQRQGFLSKHRRRLENLAPHVERIERGRPLVSSGVLARHGVKPGKAMGVLLREAERISVNQDLHDAEMVVARLKETQWWSS